MTPSKTIKRLYCFIGMPCSGKTWAAKMIAARIGATYISTGDIARSLMQSEEEREKTATKDQYMGENSLRTELTRRIENAPQGLIILDGFPRFGEQVEYLADEYHLYFPEVFEIHAGDWRTLQTRALFRGRDQQDTMEQFTLRLQAASQNMDDVYTLLQKRLIAHHTIMSTTDDIMLTQFKKLAKIK